MYSMSNELIKIPNSIVTVLKVDDEGQLWFLCTPPTFNIEECEGEFPARLHFYRKGKFYHMEVSGKATIMNRTYNGWGAGDAELRKERPILIRMTMNNVEYTAMNERKQKTKVESFLDNGYKWFLRTLALPRTEKSILSKLHQSH